MTSSTVRGAGSRQQHAGQAGSATCHRQHQTPTAFVQPTYLRTHFGVHRPAVSPYLRYFRSNRNSSPILASVGRANPLGDDSLRTVRR